MPTWARTKPAAAPARSTRPPSASARPQWRRPPGRLHWWARGSRASATRCPSSAWSQGLTRRESARRFGRCALPSFALFRSLSMRLASDSRPCCTLGTCGTSKRAPSDRRVLREYHPLTIVSCDRSCPAGSQAHAGRGRALALCGCARRRRHPCRRAWLGQNCTGNHSARGPRRVGLCAPRAHSHSFEPARQLVCGALHIQRFRSACPF